MSPSDRPTASGKTGENPNSPTLPALVHGVSVPNHLGIRTISIATGWQGRLLRNGRYHQDLLPGRHVWLDLTGAQYTVTMIDVRIHLVSMVAHGELPVGHGDNGSDVNGTTSVSVHVPLSVSMQVANIDALLLSEDPIALLTALVSTQVVLVLSQMRGLSTTPLISTVLPTLLYEVQRWLQMNSASHTGLQVLEVLITPPGIAFIGSQSEADRMSPISNANGSDSPDDPQRTQSVRREDRVRVFISHSHHDTSFCRQLAHALLDAGAVVWYDEHDLEPGQLTASIQRAMRRSSVFLPILSRSALGSTWVKSECTWAFNLYRRDQTRTILPITIEPLTQQDFDDWLFLEDFARIEAPMFQPYSETEAIRRTLEMLRLTKGREPYSNAPPSDEQPVSSLIDRGRILYSQARYADALVVLMQATYSSPDSSLAWIALGATHRRLGQYEYAFRAYEKALERDPINISAWDGKGLVLLDMKRYEDAIEAFDNALKIDPTNPDALYAKSQALNAIQRTEEAYMAEERARQIDPSVTLGEIDIPSIGTSQKPPGLQAPTNEV